MNRIDAATPEPNASTVTPRPAALATPAPAAPDLPAVRLEFEEAHGFTTGQRVYVWLTAFYCACLIIADIVGIKLFKLGPVEHTTGMLTFPVTFLLTDLLNEYYGKKAARRVAIIAFTMALFVFGAINVALAMPFLDAPYNVRPDAFNAVFGSAKIMYIASLSAFLLGALLDISVFGFLKRLTGGKMIWLRATGSTVISQMIDSLVVSYLAFGLGRQLFPDPSNPPAPFDACLRIAATGYILKFVLAIAITPLIYLGHNILHRWFGLQPLAPERVA
ncbi:MAG: queuosine precursor transporter [Phycisphaerae bacterium]